MFIDNLKKFIMFTEEEIRMFEEAEAEETNALTSEDMLEINKNIETYKEKFFKEKNKFKKLLFHTLNFGIIYILFEFLLKFDYSYILLSPIPFMLLKLFKSYQNKQLFDIIVGNLEFTKKEYLNNF